MKKGHTNKCWLLTISVMLLSITIGFSQTVVKKKYKGYFCTGINQYSPFKYDREYKHEADKFITLYRIYSPTEGYYLNITATHYKSEKKVVLDIDDASVKGKNGHVSSQEIYYLNATKGGEWYAKAGAFKNQFDAQNVLPFDFLFRFSNSKEEYVRLKEIVKDDSFNANKWYLLDEENKNN